MQPRPSALGSRGAPGFPASARSCPCPPCSREETRSPGAARGRREPGTEWGRGGRSEGTQRKRPTLPGAPEMRAGFWRFLAVPGWVRVFCPWQGAPAHREPGQWPHTAPFPLSAPLRGDWGGVRLHLCFPDPPTQQLGLRRGYGFCLLPSPRPLPPSPAQRPGVSQSGFFFLHCVLYLLAPGTHPLSETRG